jgi:uncharacterized membrane protein YGL010W
MKLKNIHLFNLNALFQDYSENHQTQGNKITHLIGVPLIVLSIIMFLTPVKLFTLFTVQITLAELIIFLLSLYYIRLDKWLGRLMLICLLGLDAIALWHHHIWSASGFFVGGWILQFIGHGLFEKRAPSFSKNLIHLLIGPLWVLKQAISKN